MLCLRNVRLVFVAYRSICVSELVAQIVWASVRACDVRNVTCSTPPPSIQGYSILVISRPTIYPCTRVWVPALFLCISPSQKTVYGVQQNKTRKASPFFLSLTSTDWSKKVRFLLRMLLFKRKGCLDIGICTEERKHSIFPLWHWQTALIPCVFNNLLNLNYVNGAVTILLL